MTTLILSWHFSLIAESTSSYVNRPSGCLSPSSHFNKTLENNKIFLESVISKKNGNILFLRRFKQNLRDNGIQGIGGITIPNNLSKSEALIYSSKDSNLTLHFFKVDSIYSITQNSYIPIEKLGTNEYIFSISDDRGLVGHGWLETPSDQLKNKVKIRIGLHSRRLNNIPYPIENIGYGTNTILLLLNIAATKNNLISEDIIEVEYHISKFESHNDIKPKLKHILTKLGFNKSIENGEIRYIYQNINLGNPIERNGFPEIMQAA